MPGFVEAEGYVKDMDYVVYKIDVPKVMPEFYNRIYERAMRKGVFEVLDFRNKKELKPWVRPILALMNECYLEGNIYGFAPLDEKEMDDLARRYMPILDPRFIKVVKKGDEVAAFIIGIPDMSEGIRKARGRLFPFGFIHILRSAKKTKQLDLLLGAVKEKYRGQGLDVMMGVRMLKSAQAAGLEIIDTHHEMETNVKVRGEMERMGGTIYKRFRVFSKATIIACGNDGAVRKPRLPWRQGRGLRRRRRCVGFRFSGSGESLRKTRPGPGESRPLPLRVSLSETEASDPCPLNPPRAFSEIPPAPRESLLARCGKVQRSRRGKIGLPEGS
jgi:hypothetical protein